MGLLLKSPLRRPIRRAWVSWFSILSALPLLAADPASPGSSTSPVTEPARASVAHPFENSLGMRFIPVPGTPVLVSIWETRVQDFEAFVRETGHAATEGTYSLSTNRWKQLGDTWQSPGFPQTPRHPVCGINWLDARAFCEWLSKKEGRRYRLPTDAEWSAAVGLPGELGQTPKEKSGRIPNLFPWGITMPPNVNGLPAGNYPGSEASETNWPVAFRVIADFRDPFARTAPVGSFPPNPLGLYDLGGNVWEWCEDESEPGREIRVVRGGSWVDNLEEILQSSYRHFIRPNSRNVSIGFRCVLEPAESPTPPGAAPKAD